MRIEGLQPDTVYYVRFFATNDEGTFYSYPVQVPTTKIYNDKVFVEMGKFMMGSAAVRLMKCLCMKWNLNIASIFQRMKSRMLNIANS